MSKNILLGVSSSISAIKSLELCQKLKSNGFFVKVVVTKNTLKLFGEEFLKEFQKNGFEVYTCLFEKNIKAEKYLNQTKDIPHIFLAKWAEIILVAPATASFIGKLANGIYDDLLSNLICASTTKIILAPAMNTTMWKQAAVQQNITKLKNYGYQIIQPEGGLLACGDVGTGRLANIDTILESLNLTISNNNFTNIKTHKTKQNFNFFQKSIKLKNKFNKFLDGFNKFAIKNKTNLTFSKTVLITAGATSQKIDEIRTITNLSSGKTGLIIAKEMLDRGFKVILLVSKNVDSSLFKDFFSDPVKVLELQKTDWNNSLFLNPNLSLEFFETFSDLDKLIEKRKNQAAIIFHCSAVSDFEIQTKNTKLSSQKEQILKLKPLPKIIKKIRQLNQKSLIIGFKLTTKDQDLVAKMKQQMIQNQLDYVIGNYQTSSTGAKHKQNQYFLLNSNLELKKFSKNQKEIAIKQVLESLDFTDFTL
jgi:phosphopantothenoylcysteine decarboxylase/phosphopantothenate--cysteine ligase